MTVEVVCVGVVTVDTVALVDRYPSEDERVLAQEIVRAGGGPAAVAAVALSRLGISTAIVGTIGDDEDGAFVRRIFDHEGINHQGLSVGTRPTSGSVIVASLEHSARAISTRQPVEQAPLNGAARKLIEQAHWIHVDQVGITRLDEMGIRRGAGPKISFDAGYGVEKFDSSRVDLFAPTDRMVALRHPGLSLEEALARDCHNNIVAATRGSQGSAAFTSESGFVEAQGFSVDVVSTLGAGDVFHGALLAQVIQGRQLQQALVRANAVAALSCRGLDGQSAIPTTAELDLFLQEEEKK